jgi:RNA 3'-terminal phosphate cyclase (ATP)
MIDVDGSFGEGGGQIVRSSLTLAAVLGVPVRIENIRARRPKPGLGNQHLAAARAVAKICKGNLEGAKKGSKELLFEPGEIRAGHYSREIGTAGSTTLILQTVLPVLASADRESAITIYGGTHNPMAPPSEFITECCLPAVALLGINASCELVRHGFYPKGGGAIKAKVEPWDKAFGPLDLTEDVDWGEPEVTVLIANLPEHVAEREQNEIAERLRIDPLTVKIEPLPGDVGPGNAVMVRYRSGDRIALITSFGEPRKRAERVAQEAARQAKNFARSKAPVDPHLADQLLLPMALGAGGSFITSEITEHARTQAEVIRAFLGAETDIRQKKSDCWLITVPGGNIPAT